MELSAVFPVFVRKCTGFYHDIRGFHTAFSVIGVLAKDGAAASKARIYDKEFDKKSAGFSSLHIYARKGMPPAHISFSCERALQYT